MKRKTIRNHRDFVTSPDDLMVRAGCFIVKAKNAKFENDARYGLVAAKKIFKLAVQRNRVKRVLRDWIAFNEKTMLPDLDYIFIARDSVLNTNREDGREQVCQALKKIAKLHTNNDKQAQYIY